jgi:alkylation response protein AidB-like acyl-CoA dehydrogenase
VNFELGEDAAVLREELRALLAEYVPEDYLGPFDENPEARAISKAFVTRLADDGLLTLAWPREFGGRGAGPWDQTVLREEMWAHYEPRGAGYLGLNWVGPAVMRFGTEYQRAFHLPRIASGESIWCQGFSEPGAGTDLASLRTRATRDESVWRVNGQKVWTSYALMANWCMVAARTGDRDSPGGGIGLFMIPMDTPGVDPRPIDSMLGHQHLNEVFFEDVVVDDEQLLGHADHGWSVIRYALAFERIGIARYARTDRLAIRLRAELGEDYAALPESVRVRFARAMVHNRMARIVSYQAIESQTSDDVDDALVGTARLLTTLCEQEVADVMMEAAGSVSLYGGRQSGALLGGAVEDFWRYTHASTVASGSIDVQRMHIARQILGSSRGT